MSGQRGIVIHIDKQQYRLEDAEVTGATLRSLPVPPVSETQDLYQEVPGGEDILIRGEVTYTVKNGTHFFTAPANINPG